jgi:hypothetical protein
MDYACPLLKWQSIYRFNGVTDQFKWSIGGIFFQTSTKFVGKNRATYANAQHTANQLGERDERRRLRNILRLYVCLNGNDGDLSTRCVRN